MMCFSHFRRYIEVKQLKEAVTFFSLVFPIALSVQIFGRGGKGFCMLNSVLQFGY